MENEINIGEGLINLDYIIIDSNNNELESNTIKDSSISKILYKKIEKKFKSNLENAGFAYDLLLSLPVINMDDKSNLKLQSLIYFYSNNDKKRLYCQGYIENNYDSNVEPSLTIFDSVSNIENKYNILELISKGEYLNLSNEEINNKYFELLDVLKEIVIKDDEEINSNDVNVITDYLKMYRYLEDEDIQKYQAIKNNFIDWCLLVIGKEYNNTINYIESIDKKIKDIDNKVATKDSFETLPIPDEYEDLKLNINLNKDELDTLKKGHIPSYTDDHFFMYYEDNKLYIYLHTGYCIFIVDVPDSGNIIHAKAVKEERESRSREESIKLLTKLILEHHKFFINQSKEDLEFKKQMAFNSLLKKNQIKEKVNLEENEGKNISENIEVIDDDNDEKLEEYSKQIFYLIKTMPYNTKTTIAELINYNPDKTSVSPLMQGKISNNVELLCKENKIVIDYDENYIGGLAFYYPFVKVDTEVILANAENQSKMLYIKENDPFVCESVKNIYKALLIVKEYSNISFMKSISNDLQELLNNYDKVLEVLTIFEGIKNSIFDGGINYIVIDLSNIESLKYLLNILKESLNTNNLSISDINSIKLDEKQPIEQLVKTRIENTEDYITITSKVKWGVPSDLPNGFGSFAIAIPYEFIVDGIKYNGIYELNDASSSTPDYNPRYNFYVTNLTSDGEMEVLIEKKLKLNNEIEYIDNKIAELEIEKSKIDNEIEKNFEEV